MKNCVLGKICDLLDKLINQLDMLSKCICLVLDKMSNQLNMLFKCICNMY